MLGLSGSVTEDAIKKAYRKKGRHLHPDRSADENANSLFNELQEAYEAALEAMAPSAPSMPPSAASAPPPAAPRYPYPVGYRFIFPTPNLKPVVNLTLEMADIYTGKQVMLEFYYAQLCRTCFVTGPFPTPCGRCRGSGMATTSKFYAVVTEKCLPCKGTGYSGDCAECNGSRGVMKKTQLKYTFPPHHDFKRFDTITGKGHEWYGEGKINRADVMLNVSIAPTKGFSLEEKSGDLLTFTKISLRASLMTSRLHVTLPGGSQALIDVCDVIRNGSVFRLPMMALYPTSYLYVCVEVELPSRADIVAGYSIAAASETAVRDLQATQKSKDTRIARTEWPQWVQSLVAMKLNNSPD